MKVAHGLAEYTGTTSTAVTLGVFDGVHRGHQALLRATAEQATAHGAEAVALLLHPHPELTLRGTAPLLLTTLEERITLIERLGLLDWLVVLRFDAALASTTAERFAEEFLQKRLRARAVVLGPHARYGQGARGDADLLRRLAPPSGWEVRTLPVQRFGEHEARSDVVRRLIASGDVAAAGLLLGRWHHISGTVERGRAVGKRLGFPTANLRPPAEHALPPFGIYAAWATVDGRKVAAAVSYGVRPTYDLTEPWIEAHLLDAGEVGDLARRVMRVAFVKRLRDEERFDSETALRAQIAADCEAARKVLASVSLPVFPEVLQ